METFPETFLLRSIVNNKDFEEQSRRYVAAIESNFAKMSSEEADAETAKPLEVRPEFFTLLHKLLDVAPIIHSETRWLVAYLNDFFKNTLMIFPS